MPDKSHSSMPDDTFDFARAFGHMEQRLVTIEERLERQNVLGLRTAERLDVLSVIDHRLSQVELWKKGLWKAVILTSISIATLASMMASAMLWIAKH